MTESNSLRKFRKRFENIAATLTKISGSTLAIIIALSLLILWGFSGLIFRYSEEWLSIINKGTTVVTFLMVFIIQRAQNKDSLAIQLKLNELIAVTKGASNRLVDVEELSEKELVNLKKDYTEISAIFEKDNDINESRTTGKAESGKNKKIKDITINDDEK